MTAVLSTFTSYDNTCLGITTAAPPCRLPTSDGMHVRQNMEWPSGGNTPRPKPASASGETLPRPSLISANRPRESRRRPLLQIFPARLQALEQTRPWPREDFHAHPNVALTLIISTKGHSTSLETAELTSDTLHIARTFSPYLPLLQPLRLRQLHRWTCSGTCLNPKH